MLEEAIQSTLERLLSKDGTGTPPNLADSIRYSLLAPGKRIRPRLSLACAELVDLPRPAALAAGIAIEMVHCFTLIHDDLPCMDDDDFRRGRPSNHKVYGEAIALLAGDGLQALAVDSLLESVELGVPADRVFRALRTLTQAMGPRGVIGGQAAEPLLNEASTLADVERMHAGKTGALFTASILIPAELAGLDPSSNPYRALERFADALGLAFQAVDDLEDAEQDRENRSLTTVLRHLPEQEARSRARQRLQGACDSLRESWGTASSGSGPLLAIAAEVLRKL